MHTIPFRSGVSFASLVPSPPPSPVRKSLHSLDFNHQVLNKVSKGEAATTAPTQIQKESLIEVLVNAFGQLMAQYPTVDAFNEEDMQDFLECIWNELGAIERGNSRVQELVSSSSVTPPQTGQCYLGGVFHYALRMIQGRIDYWQDHFTHGQSADEMVWAAFRELIAMLVNHAQAQAQAYIPRIGSQQAHTTGQTNRMVITRVLFSNR